MELLRTIDPLRILRDKIAGIGESLIALVPNLIAALVAVALTWAFAMVLARVAGRLSGRRMRGSLRQVIVSLTRIVVWLVGLLVTATILFPNLTPTKALAGLGIGSIAVGLAFKDIFENFLAGILILIREPMRIGDDIDCEGVTGRVEKITIRDTYIRQRSGELVLTPNSFLFKNPIKILTDRPLRRIELVVGVAYGEDIDAARAVILGAFDGLGHVDRTQAIDVLAREFNESSVDFLVRWWTGSTPVDEHKSRDEVTAAIKRALDTAGVEIPFPYRTLTFKEPLRLDGGPSQGG